MKNSLPKPTGFKKVTKYIAISLFIAVLGTAVLLILSYPRMKEFKKSWLSLECTWGDKEFKSQYIGKMHIWKTPGGSYPCQEENGYVKCLVVNKKGYYAGNEVNIKVYTVFKNTLGTVGLSILSQVEGIPSKYIQGYCAQLDAVYDPKLNGCVKKVGVCQVKEVQF